MLKNITFLPGVTPIKDRIEDRLKDWRKDTIDNIKKLNLKTSKSKGQNFLIRYRVVSQIVENANVTKEDHILEIGGGLGILTEALAITGAKITVIEKEKKLADFLENKFKNKENVEIINADVLNVKWPEKVKIVANLPYSISTPIIEKIMHNNVGEAYIMIQREVALRCLAEPGNENYSRLSLLCKTHAKISRLMDISPESFVPKPKVNSTVIKIIKRKLDLKNEHEDIELLIRNLFILKRRILRSVIRGYLKRKNVSEGIWDDCPYSEKRINELSIFEIDEILSFLKINNVFPLA